MPAIATPEGAKAFRRFIQREGSALAAAVLSARAEAQIAQEQTEALVSPIFARYTFPVREEWRSMEGKAAAKTLDDLYLCDDEPTLARFYAECDKAFKDAGYDLPAGHWPNLVAKAEASDAETELLKRAAPVLGFDAHRLYGENRTKALDLLLGAAVAARKGK